MSRVTPRTMSGTLELLPQEQVSFQRMLDRIRSSFERFGFLPIETPALEHTEVLLTKSGGETEKQVYFAQSSGARAQGKEPVLALRFDNTVPLARYVAQHEGQLTFPFRRYQIQRVYRGERVQRGRYREFYQCDIDVVGKDTLPLEFDAEIPAVIAHTFPALDIGPFTIHLNNRRLLLGLVESLGVHDAEIQVQLVRELDKLDKRGREAVQDTLSGERFGLGQEGAARLMEWTGFSGSNQEILEQLSGLGIDSPLFRQGFEEMQAVVEALRFLQVGEGICQLDLAVARGLDYYTGTVYETLLDDHRDRGSICSGGRYDDLASLYTKSRLPGVGISIGATRLFDLLQKIGRLPVGETVVEVLVTRMDEKLASDYLQLASELRAAGINTEIFFAGGKFGKQMKYADRARIPVALILGENEANNGTVLVKDLTRSDQKEVPRGEVVAAVKGCLSRE